MILRCENNVKAVNLTEKWINSSIETNGYSFFGRLLLVKNQNLRNVTGVTLNKYTESQHNKKHFIREMYTANVERHLKRKQFRNVSVDYNESYYHKFCLQLLNAD